ncbi:hypothetical protein RNZ50_14445 [Paracoccaceae bacterium Fryx2]|nr:hypothetical protein [Paracoccaceae bacterium Fryx2]
MSEPMTTHDIEDVLSSIRRLVSEDLRPAPRPAPQADGADKLILTPALRVVAREEPAPGAVGGQGGDKDAACPWPAAGAQDRAVPAPEPSAEPEIAADWMPEAEDDPSDDMPEAGSDLQSLLDGLTGRTPPEAETDPDAPTGTLGAAVAAMGAAVSDRNEDWEAEAAAPPDHFDIRAPEPADAARAGAVEDAEVIGETPARVPEPDRGTAAVAEDGLGAPEPDWAARVRATQARADQAEAEAVAEILGAEAAAQPQPAETVGVFDEEDPVLDEEMLRDLVRDIIREELQGALGERITRNVRKLVRAEINRSLASRDFD